MNGKSKCKILKDIRRQIAQDNDIEYVTSECKHKGDCAGTCPKCEAEVRYLEEELRKRQWAGKAVAVAGIAASLMVTAAGCELPFLAPTGGDPLPPSQSQQEMVDGEIAPPPTDPSECELPGVPPYPPETTEPETVEPMGNLVLSE